MIDVEKTADDLIYDRPVSKHFRDHLMGFLMEAYGIDLNPLTPDLEVFVNCQSNTYQKELNNICGSVQLSPVRVTGKEKKKVISRRPDCGQIDFSKSKLLYDSGAFSDVSTGCRVTAEESLTRQLHTLSLLPQFSQVDIVSYDLLIDEKHVNGAKIKNRWSVEEGIVAVRETVEASRYLDSQRDRLNGYGIIQSCQGVDAEQYLECVEEVLQYCKPEDCLGLGGWCILGMQKRWLPTFHQVVEKVIPVVAEAGIKRVHIFGVTWYKASRGYPPPLPLLLYYCDLYGIKLSTDGRSPISNALWKNYRQAGATFPNWRHNLAWVKTEMACLKDSPHYGPINSI